MQTQFALSRELIRTVYNSFYKLRDRAERIASRAIDNAADLLTFGRELRQVALLGSPAPRWAGLRPPRGLAADGAPALSCPCRRGRWVRARGRACLEEHRPASGRGKWFPTRMRASFSWVVLPLVRIRLREIGLTEDGACGLWMLWMLWRAGGAPPGPRPSLSGSGAGFQTRPAGAAGVPWGEWAQQAQGRGPLFPAGSRLLTAAP